MMNEKCVWFLAPEKHPEYFAHPRKGLGVMGLSHNIAGSGSASENVIYSVFFIEEGH